MQISSISTAVQSNLGVSNQGADGARRTPTATENGSVEDSTQVSGVTSASSAVQPVEASLSGSAVSETEAVPLTQLVTATGDVLATEGTAKGQVVDITI